MFPRGTLISKLTPSKSKSSIKIITSKILKKGNAWCEEEKGAVKEKEEKIF